MISDSDGAGADTAPAVADLARPLRATLRGIASVVAPTTIATSLFFYFGWTRTSTQAAAMGLDDSLLGYSTQDYVLRSVDPMFWPLFVGTLTVLAALSAHAWIAHWSDDAGPGHRRRLRWVIVAVGVVGVASLGLGAVGVRVQAPSRLVSLASPLCITAGIVLVGYGLYLRSRLLAIRANGRVNVPPPELQQLRLVASSLVVLLVLLSLFWSVARYAQIKGIDLASKVERDLPFLPDVTIYSAKNLQLQPPVIETDLGDDGAAYRFRYTGLKLLFRAQHRYFLQPADNSGARVNIVVAESDDIRFEFAPAGR